MFMRDLSENQIIDYVEAELGSKLYSKLKNDYKNTQF